MFPAGKKKLLHQLQRAQNPRVRRQLLASLANSGSSRAQQPASSPHARPSRLGSGAKETDPFSSSSNVDSITAKDVWQYKDNESLDPEIRSAANKLIRAAYRFRWDRDGWLSRALEAPNLSHSEFRQLIDKVLDLRFHDTEFAKLALWFSTAGVIDGTRFLNTFIKLGSDCAVLTFLKLQN
jgi:hypothetical protein